ncbi:MAG: tetratricopeptide repeat protein, partial [Pyrinomonadaceae bacterium]
MFASSAGRIATEQELKNYLYGQPRAASDRLWERVEGTKLLYTYYGDHFKTFLRDNINDELVSWFGEELKTDNRECNKAWRAFQRMLQEGIRADVIAIQANQEMIREDLKVLDLIRDRLDEIKDTIDQRTPNEPFQQGLFEALNGMKVLLEDVAETTHRTETKVDVVVATTERTETKLDTVVAALSPTPKVEGPKIPQPIRDAINRGVDFTNSSHFEKAKKEFQQALEMAEEAQHALATVDAKEHLALVLIHFDHDLATAKALLQSCLDILTTEDDDEERSEVLERLARVYDQEGDLELSESLLCQSLAISERLGDKQAQAGTLVGLAWTIGRGGRTHEALSLNMKAYDLLAQVLHETKQDDVRSVEFIHTILGNLFFQRAKIHQRRAEPDEAEAALNTALIWQRKVPANHELAKLLRELATLKFFRRDLNEGAELLEEAARIYQDREMMTELAECLHMMGRVQASVGDFAKAGEFFSSAAAAATKSGQSQEAAEVLLSLAHLASERGDAESARQLLDSARTTSDRRDFQAECLMELARLASNDERKDEHLELVREAVDLLKAELAGTKHGMERAKLCFTLGWYLREAGQIEEALNYVRKAGERFEAANDAYGAAKAKFETAGLLDHMGRKEAAREVCNVVLKMIEGKPFYEIEAAVHFSLAQFSFHDDKNLVEAERLLEHSLELCKQHNLQLLPQALLFKDALQTKKRAGTETAASIPDLLDFLHEQLALCSVNAEGYLRFWAFCHARKFESALRASLGPNIAILTDDLAEFVQVSSWFKPYRDWSLIVPSQAYPENLYETISFTEKMLIPADGVAILGVKRSAKRDPQDESLGQTPSNREYKVSPQLRAEIALSGLSSGGSLARYFYVPLEESTQEFGGARAGAQGWSMALPPTVHDLLQGRNVEELKSNRLFFIYYNRGGADEKDRFWYDLAIFHRYRCFPVYSGALPRSEKVRVVASSPVSLPVINHVSDKEKPTLRKIRKALSEVLLASETNAAEKLSELSAMTEDLAEEVGGECKRLVFYL